MEEPATAARSTAAGGETGQPSAARVATWQRCDEREVVGVMNQARQGVHCSLFCGGAKCKHEDYTLHTHHKNVHPAIVGLNSHWVGDVIVASQRPSTSLFFKHVLVEQFKAKKVAAVFNLQEKGEHASCGPDGIYPETGYSYNAEKDLMKYGIAYYEFPWPDMTAPDLDIVRRAVHCMDHHITTERMRVLVHCHAGLGRTGLMIACYFMLAQRRTAQYAIELVRRCRPGAIQTSSQVEFCRQFELYVRRLAHTFKTHSGDDMVTFTDFLMRQEQLLHGAESRALRYVPRHVFYCLSQLIQLTQTSAARVRRVALKAFAPSVCPDPSEIASCVARMNSGSFAASAVVDVPLLAYLSVEWFRRLDEPLLGPADVTALLDAIKAPPTSTATADNGGSPVAVAASALSRTKRHTVGCVLSALHVLGRELPEAHLSAALLYCTDAFAQCSAASPDEQHQFLSPGERSLLHQAMALWAEDVGSAYWEPHASPTNRRVIRMMADFSATTATVCH